MSHRQKFYRILYRILPEVGQFLTLLPIFQLYKK